VNIPGLEKVGALVAVVLVAQVWSRLRVARLQKKLPPARLFDPVALEIVLASQESTPAWEDLRAELRQHNQPDQAADLARLLVQHGQSLPAEHYTAFRAFLGRLDSSGDAGLRELARLTAQEIPAGISETD
jgi:hypothetical protein